MFGYLPFSGRVLVRFVIRTRSRFWLLMLLVSVAVHLFNGWAAILIGGAGLVSVTYALANVGAAVAQTYVVWIFWSKFAWFKNWKVNRKSCTDSILAVVFTVCCQIFVVWYVTEG
jgi:uncharacterized membrane protein